MSLQLEILDFIKDRTLVEMARGEKDEGLYSAGVAFSRMGISERGAIWIAGEIENRFDLSLVPLLRQNPKGKESYRALKPDEITKYVIKRGIKCH